jgi:hypothetical protein
MCGWYSIKYGRPMRYDVGMSGIYFADSATVAAAAATAVISETSPPRRSTYRL